MERDLGPKVERDLGLKMGTDFGTHFSVRASALCDPYRKNRAAVPKNVTGIGTHFWAQTLFQKCAQTPPKNCTEPEEKTPAA